MDSTWLRGLGWRFLTLTESVLGQVRHWLLHLHFGCKNGLELPLQALGRRSRGKAERTRDGADARSAGTGRFGDYGAEGYGPEEYGAD